MLQELDRLEESTPWNQSLVRMALDKPSATGYRRVKVARVLSERRGYCLRGNSLPRVQQRTAWNTFRACTEPQSIVLSLTALTISLELSSLCFAFCQWTAQVIRMKPARRIHRTVGPLSSIIPREPRGGISGWARHLDFNALTAMSEGNKLTSDSAAGLDARPDRPLSRASGPWSGIDWSKSGD